jgi:hypothetical protein
MSDDDDSSTLGSRGEIRLIFILDLSLFAHLVNNLYHGLPGLAETRPGFKTENFPKKLRKNQIFAVLKKRGQERPQPA